MDSIVNLFNTVLRRAGRRAGVGADEDTGPPPFEEAPAFNSSLTRGVITPADVHVVRAMLQALKLPTEIVLDILEVANYWPSWKFSTKESVSVVVQHHHSSSDAMVFCFEAEPFQPCIVKPFGDEKFKVKEIEFNFQSKDQGWTSEETGGTIYASYYRRMHNFLQLTRSGTYQTSSWLEVSILRRMDPSARETNLAEYGVIGLLRNTGGFHDRLDHRQWALVERPKKAARGPQSNDDRFAWYLQGNKVAEPSALDYKVVWSTIEGNSEGNEGAGNGEGFLQELKEGDRILVWARAKWGGWACLVKNVSMTVRYGH